MVEMAAVAIFLILLVLGILDLGRVIVTSIAVRDAVQEGASFAAYTENATDVEIDSRIRGAVSSPDLSTALIDLYCIEESREIMGGSRVRIEMSYDVDLVTPVIGQMLGGSLTLTPDAEIDRFYEDCPSGVSNPIP